MTRNHAACIFSQPAKAAQRNIVKKTKFFLYKKKKKDIFNDYHDNTYDDDKTDDFIFNYTLTYLIPKW